MAVAVAGRFCVSRGTNQSENRARRGAHSCFEGNEPGGDELEARRRFSFRKERTNQESAQGEAPFFPCDTGDEPVVSLRGATAGRIIVGKCGGRVDRRAALAGGHGRGVDAGLWWGIAEGKVRGVLTVLVLGGRWADCFGAWGGNKKSPPEAWSLWGAFLRRLLC